MCCGQLWLDILLSSVLNFYLKYLMASVSIAHMPISLIRYSTFLARLILILLMSFKAELYTLYKSWHFDTECHLLKRLFVKF